MLSINENYLKLNENYLFSDIAKKVAAYEKETPEREIIRLGIGDVTLPLAPAIIEALHSAVDEQSKPETFRGYSPDLGYGFLREVIAEEDFVARGCEVYPDEIFISDGAKSDSGNIQEIFGQDVIVALGDPVYPVYLDSNTMSGRTGEYDESTGRFSKIVYLPASAENNFVPSLPSRQADLIYLCYPNNPTGTTLTKDELQAWVDYANQEKAVIIFDAAYEAYISEENIPHSIYECEGARTCAIEIRSFSKIAGFTGLRLGFTVVPKDLLIDGHSVRDLWARRHGTKFNGAPYIVQRAGAAVYTDEGRSQITEQIAYYMNNAKVIREGLIASGFEVFGGVNAPYVWLKTPEGMGSWEFFDFLLKNAQVVGTPGAGFGPSGEGYFRLTGFGNAEKTKEAVRRVTQLFKA